MREKRRLETEHQSEKKKIAKKRRKSLRRSKARFEKKCESHPEMSSFLVKGVLNPKEQKRSIQFIQQKFEDLSRRYIAFFSVCHR